MTPKTLAQDEGRILEETVARLRALLKEEFSRLVVRGHHASSISVVQKWAVYETLFGSCRIDRRMAGKFPSVDKVTAHREIAQDILDMTAEMMDLIDSRHAHTIVTVRKERSKAKRKS